MTKRKSMKKCKFCNEVFFTSSNRRSFCSLDCKKKYVKVKEKAREERGQICWHCINATGGCSWSRSLTPVDGWQAIPTFVKSKGQIQYRSYKIITCPQYIREEEKK